MNAETNINWSACRYGAEDEALHPPLDEGSYNESAYFNFVCPPTEKGPLGGVVRVGLRPVDKYRETTVLVVLADGTTLFRYARDEFSFDEFEVGGSELAAAGTTLAATVPLRTWAVKYEGEARLLPDLARFGDSPGVEWRATPASTASIDLEFTANHPIHTLTPGGGLAPGASDETGARNHYEQFGHLNGSIVIDDERFELVDIPSMRDRSWGPRAWDAIPNADQIMAFMDDGTRFVSLNNADGSGVVHAHGMAWVPGRDSVVDTPVFDHIEAYDGRSSMVDAVPLRLVVDDRTVELGAQVVAMFPTRVGSTHRDALALVRLDGDLGPGAAWIDMMRPRLDS